MNLQNTQNKRVKLIFNPASGAGKESPLQLMDVIREMQDGKLVPEPYLTEPDTDYRKLVNDAIGQGIRMFAVCGGDGTVSAVARALVDTDTILGIIPSGTQNNIAYSLGIPADTKAAIANFVEGRPVKIDIGMVSCCGKTVPFLEVCSVGLFSTLYSSGDSIQHGDILKIGDFLSALTSSVPSEIGLELDNEHQIKDNGHVVLVANMPFIGRHYQVGSEDSYNDGLLDVVFCANVPKLDLVVGYMLKLPEAAEDPRIHHFKVRDVKIDANPRMPVIADGMELGEGPVTISVRRQALSVLMSAKSGKTEVSGDKL